LKNNIKHINKEEIPMKVILTYLSIFVIATLLITCGSSEDSQDNGSSEGITNTIDVECQSGREIQITCDDTTVVTLNCTVGNEVNCGSYLFRVTYESLDTTHYPIELIPDTTDVDLSTIEAEYISLP
jgi:hypothetical protein